MIHNREATSAATREWRWQKAETGDGGADEHQGVRCPVGPGEDRTEPADQVILGDHGVIDRRLHRAGTVRIVAR